MKSEVLGCLTDSDWHVLLEGARRATYRKGDVILEEGSTRRAIFILDRGYATIESSAHGRGIRLNQIGPGEIFGEISFLEDSGASASAIAEEDAEVRIIEEGQIESLLTAVPGLATRFYQSLALTLARRLRRLSDRVSQTKAAADPPEREFQVLRASSLGGGRIPEALATALERFRTQLLDVERQVQTEKLSDEDASRRVGEVCDDLFETFARQIGDRDGLAPSSERAKIESAIGDYVFREAFPLLMRSATLACCHTRGRSYPNDYLIGEAILRNEAKGDGKLGIYIDRWFLSRPFCQAYRAGRQLLEETILAAEPSGGSRIRIASLAGGSGRELFDLLAKGTTGANPARKGELTGFYATCIDSSPEALAFCARQSQRLGTSDRMNILQGDIRSLVEGRDRLALPPQQFIYGFDLCDRWPDERVAALLDWVAVRLAKGGTAIFSNFKPSLPDRLLLRHILNWQQHYRNEDDWRGLVERSRLGGGRLEFESDGNGWMLLAIASKKA